MRKVKSILPGLALGSVLVFDFAIVAGVTGLVQVSQAAGPAVNAGTLTCKQVHGSRVNLLVHSTADIRCVYKRADGTEERYKGETGVALGVDLQWKTDATIMFAVIGAGLKSGSYALAGKYVGAKASASVAKGGGVTALVGGSTKKINLKPAVEKTSGVGASAGLGYMYLEPDRK